VRKRDGARNPICLSTRAIEAAVPIEIRGSRLKQHSNVTQPDWSYRAMTQQMHAKKPQMILCAQYPHIKIVELDQLRARKNIICPRVVEFTESLVQIHIAPLAFGTLKDLPGNRSMFR